MWRRRYPDGRGERWRSAIGSARSLVIYYGHPMRRRRMDRLYSDFVRQGDLVFDIGSHVGDRIGSFRRRGCRVVAVEPQPRLVRILRRFYGRDLDVAIEPNGDCRGSRKHRALRQPRQCELDHRIFRLCRCSVGGAGLAWRALAWPARRSGNHLGPANQTSWRADFCQNRCRRFRGRGTRRTFATARGILLQIHDDYAPGRDRLRDPLSGARRVPLQCRSGRKPTPGTSHRHRLEENAGAVSLRTSADTEDALLQEFAPGAASGLRYPESHLARLGI